MEAILDWVRQYNKQTFGGVFKCNIERHGHFWKVNHTSWNAAARSTIINKEFVCKKIDLFSKPLRYASIRRRTPLDVTM